MWLVFQALKPKKFFWLPGSLHGTCCLLPGPAIRCSLPGAPAVLADYCSSPFGRYLTTFWAARWFSRCPVALALPSFVLVAPLAALVVGWRLLCGACNNCSFCMFAASPFPIVGGCLSNLHLHAPGSLSLMPKTTASTLAGGCSQRPPIHRHLTRPRRPLPSLPLLSTSFEAAPAPLSLLPAPRFA
jgi:hypothetical protein